MQAVTAAPIQNTIATTASKRWHAWRRHRKQFPIAAWSYFSRYPGTAAGYRTYAGAGLTMVQAPRDQVAAAKEAGLDVLVGSWENLWKSTAKMEQAVNFPTPADSAVIGYLLDDEPGPKLFPKLGAATRYIYEHDQRGAIPIVDMLPSWAVVYGRFGMTYENYVRSYIKQVHPAVLMYDYYPVVWNGDKQSERPTFYYDLEFYRHLALKHDIGLMAFALVTGHSPGGRMAIYRTPSASDLRWEVYSDLAYGAKGIWYYNYRIGIKHYTNGMVAHKTGEPTPTYHLVRTLNHELQAIGPTLLGLRSVCVYHTGNDIPLGAHRYHNGTVPGITTFAGERFILGSFTSLDDPVNHDRYLMIVNKRHGPDKASSTFTSRCAFTVDKIFPYVYRYNIQTGKLEKMSAGTDSLYTVEIVGGRGILLRLAKQPVH